ncbi:MAG: putative nucleotidyltransferase substrate binding domain-containing protein, partial [Candidatus Omnitrophica bacterium]|nr:putative nucleotidyltransferase substrate binding domain-containing protein [Candidatus Omnitrophota bacterium]
GDLAGDNALEVTPVNRNARAIIASNGVDGVTNLPQLSGRANGQGRMPFIAGERLLTVVPSSDSRITDIQRREISNALTSADREGIIEKALHNVDAFELRNTIRLVKANTEAKPSRQQVREILEIMDSAGKLELSARPEGYRGLAGVARANAEGVEPISGEPVLALRDGKMIQLSAESLQENVVASKTRYWQVGTVGYYLGEDDDLYAVERGAVPQKVNLSEQVSFKATDGTGYNVKRGMNNTFTVTALEGRNADRPIKLTGRFSLTSGENKVRAEKVYLLNAQGVEAPVILPVAAAKQITSTKATKENAPAYRNTAFISTQVMTGDAQTGPQLKNIDIGMTRNNNWLSRYMPQRITDFMPGKSFNFSILTSGAQYFTPGLMAQSDISFVNRLLSRGESAAAAQYTIYSLARQTKDEFYREGALTAEDIALRQQRAGILLERQGSSVLPLLLMEGSLNQQSGVSSPLMDTAAKGVLRDLRTLHSVWVNPRLYNDYLNNGETASDFNARVQAIRETQGQAAVDKLLKVAAEPLNTKASTLADKDLAYLQKLTDLTGRRADVEALLKERAPEVKLVLPEEMNDRDRGRAAYDHNTNQVSISWTNVDGAGGISDQTFWQFDFWHETLDHPALHTTGILPLDADHALSEVSAQYLSTRRFVDNVRSDRALRNSRQVYDRVLNPLLGVESKLGLLALSSEKIARRLYERYAKINPALNVNEVKENTQGGGSAAGEGIGGGTGPGAGGAASSPILDEVIKRSKAELDTLRYQYYKENAPLRQVSVRLTTMLKALVSEAAGEAQSQLSDKQIEGGRNVFVVMTGSLGREEEFVFESDLDYLVLADRDSLAYARALDRQLEEILSTTFKDHKMGVKTDFGLREENNFNIPIEEMPTKLLKAYELRENPYKMEVVDGKIVYPMERHPLKAASNPFRDMQFIWGNRELYNKLMSLADPYLYPYSATGEVLNAQGAELTEAEIGYYKEDTERYNIDSLMEEFDVKHKAIRPIQRFIWIMRARYGIKDHSAYMVLDKLAERGILTQEENAKIKAAYEFFMRTRNAIFTIEPLRGVEPTKIPGMNKIAEAMGMTTDSFKQIFINHFAESQAVMNHVLGVGTSPSPLGQAPEKIEAPVIEQSGKVAIPQIRSQEAGIVPEIKNKGPPTSSPVVTLEKTQALLRETPAVQGRDYRNELTKISSSPVTADFGEFDTKMQQQYNWWNKLTPIQKEAFFNRGLLTGTITEDMLFNSFNVAQVNDAIKHLTNKENVRTLYVLRMLDHINIDMMNKAHGWKEASTKVQRLINSIKKGAEAQQQMLVSADGNGVRALNNVYGDYIVDHLISVLNSVLREEAERLGGEAWRRNEGDEFIIRLPLGPEDNADAKVADLQKAVLDRFFKNYTVLTLDNEYVNGDTSILDKIAEDDRVEMIGLQPIAGKYNILVKVDSQRQDLEDLRFEFVDLVTKIIGRDVDLDFIKDENSVRFAGGYMAPLTLAAAGVSINDLTAANKAEPELGVIVNKILEAADNKLKERKAALKQLINIAVEHNHKELKVAADLFEKIFGYKFSEEELAIIKGARSTRRRDLLDFAKSMSEGTWLGIYPVRYEISRALGQEEEQQVPFSGINNNFGYKFGDEVIHSFIKAIIFNLPKLIPEGTLEEEKGNLVAELTHYLSNRGADTNYLVVRGKISEERLREFANAVENSFQDLTNGYIKVNLKIAAVSFDKEHNDIVETIDVKTKDMEKTLKYVTLNPDVVPMGGKKVFTYNTFSKLGLTARAQRFYQEEGIINLVNRMKNMGLASSPILGNIWRTETGFHGTDINALAGILRDGRIASPYGDTNDFGTMAIAQVWAVSSNGIPVIIKVGQAYVEKHGMLNRASALQGVALGRDYKHYQLSEPVGAEEITHIILRSKVDQAQLMKLLSEQEISLPGHIAVVVNARDFEFGQETADQAVQKAAGQDFSSSPLEGLRGITKAYPEIITEQLAAALNKYEEDPSNISSAARLYAEIWKTLGIRSLDYSQPANLREQNRVGFVSEPSKAVLQDALQQLERWHGLKVREHLREAYTDNMDLKVIGYQPVRDLVGRVVIATLEPSVYSPDGTRLIQGRVIVGIPQIDKAAGEKNQTPASSPISEPWQKNRPIPILPQAPVLPGVTGAVLSASGTGVSMLTFARGLGNASPVIILVAPATGIESLPVMSTIGASTFGTQLNDNAGGVIGVAGAAQLPRHGYRQEREQSTYVAALTGTKAAALPTRADAAAVPPISGSGNGTGSSCNAIVGKIVIIAGAETVTLMQGILAGEVGGLRDYNLIHPSNGPPANVRLTTLARDAKGVFVFQGLPSNSPTDTILSLNSNNLVNNTQPFDSLPLHSRGVVRNSTALTAYGVFNASYAVINFQGGVSWSPIIRILNSNTSLPLTQIMVYSVVPGIETAGSASTLSALTTSGSAITVPGVIWTTQTQTSSVNAPNSLIPTSKFQFITPANTHYNASSPVSTDDAEVTKPSPKQESKPVLSSTKLSWTEVNGNNRIKFLGELLSRNRMSLTRPVIYQGKRYIAKMSNNGVEDEYSIIPEAEILTQINKLNINGVSRAAHLLELSDGRKIILLEEFPKGETLDNRIAKQGAIPEKQAIGVILSVAHIVRELERYAIYHWDIKPGNIWLIFGGEVILFDFGISFRSYREFHDNYRFRMHTPQYSSERRKRYRNTLDPDDSYPYPPVREEIYSLALTLAVSLTGRNHIDFISPMIFANRQLDLLKDRKISPKLAKVLFRAIADGDSTYLSLNEFIADLEEAEKTASDEILVPDSEEVLDLTAADDTRTTRASSPINNGGDDNGNGKTRAVTPQEAPKKEDGKTRAVGPEPKLDKTVVLTDEQKAAAVEEAARSKVEDALPLAEIVLEPVAEAETKDINKDNLLRVYNFVVGHLERIYKTQLSFPEAQAKTILADPKAFGFRLNGKSLIKAITVADDQRKVVAIELIAETDRSNLFAVRISGLPSRVIKLSKHMKAMEEMVSTWAKEELLRKHLQKHSPKGEDLTRYFLFAEPREWIMTVTSSEGVADLARLEGIINNFIKAFAEHPEGIRLSVEDREFLEAYFTVRVGARRLFLSPSRELDFKTLDRVLDEDWNLDKVEEAGRKAAKARIEAEKEAFLDNLFSIAGATHRAKVYHGDVKPQNIMRRNDNMPYFLDLELTKWIDDEGRINVFQVTIAVTPNYTHPIALLAHTVIFGIIHKNEEYQGLTNKARLLLAIHDIYAFFSLSYKVATGKLLVYQEFTRMINRFFSAGAQMPTGETVGPLAVPKSKLTGQKPNKDAQPGTETIILLDPVKDKNALESLKMPLTPQEVAIWNVEFVKFVDGKLAEIADNSIFKPGLEKRWLYVQKGVSEVLALLGKQAPEVEEITDLVDEVESGERASLEPRDVIERVRDGAIVGDSDNGRVPQLRKITNVKRDIAAVVAAFEKGVRDIEALISKRANGWIKEAGAIIDVLMLTKHALDEAIENEKRNGYIRNSEVEALESLKMGFEYYGEIEGDLVAQYKQVQALYQRIQAAAEEIENLKWEEYFAVKEPQIQQLIKERNSGSLDFVIKLRMLIHDLEEAFGEDAGSVPARKIKQLYRRLDLVELRDAERFMMYMPQGLYAAIGNMYENMTLREAIIELLRSNNEWSKVTLIDFLSNYRTLNANPLYVDIDLFRQLHNLFVDPNAELANAAIRLVFSLHTAVINILASEDVGMQRLQSTLIATLYNNYNNDLLKGIITPLEIRGIFRVLYPLLNGENKVLKEDALRFIIGFLASNKIEAAELFTDPEFALEFFRVMEQAAVDKIINRVRLDQVLKGALGCGSISTETAEAMERLNSRLNEITAKLEFDKLPVKIDIEIFKAEILAAVGEAEGETRNEILSKVYFPKDLRDDLATAVSQRVVEMNDLITDIMQAIDLVVKMKTAFSDMAERLNQGREADIYVTISKELYLRLVKYTEMYPMFGYHSVADQLLGRIQAAENALDVNREITSRLAEISKNLSVKNLEKANDLLREIEVLYEQLLGYIQSAKVESNMTEKVAGKIGETKQAIRAEEKARNELVTMEEQLRSVMKVLKRPEAAEFITLRKEPQDLVTIVYRLTGLSEDRIGNFLIAMAKDNDARKVKEAQGDKVVLTKGFRAQANKFLIEVRDHSKSDALYAEFLNKNNKELVEVVVRILGILMEDWEFNLKNGFLGIEKSYVLPAEEQDPFGQALDEFTLSAVIPNPADRKKGPGSSSPVEMSKDEATAMVYKFLKYAVNNELVSAEFSLQGINPNKLVNTMNSIGRAVILAKGLVYARGLQVIKIKDNYEIYIEGEPIEEGTIPEDVAIKDGDWLGLKHTKYNDFAELRKILIYADNAILSGEDITTTDVSKFIRNFKSAIKALTENNKTASSPINGAIPQWMKAMGLMVVVSLGVGYGIVKVNIANNHLKAEVPAVTRGVLTE